MDACNEHRDFLERAARRAGIEPEDGRMLRINNSRQSPVSKGKVCRRDPEYREALGIRRWPAKF